MAEASEENQIPRQCIRTPRGNYTTYVIVDGQQRWKTFGKNVREAIAWRADVQSKVRRGELTDASLKQR